MLERASCLWLKTKKVQCVSGGKGQAIYSSFQVESHVAAVRHEGFHREKAQSIGQGPNKSFAYPLRTRPAITTFQNNHYCFPRNQTNHQQ